MFLVDATRTDMPFLSLEILAPTLSDFLIEHPLQIFVCDIFAHLPLIQYYILQLWRQLGVRS